MRCEKCGVRNSAASRFCRKCGEPLGQVAVPRPQDALPARVQLERARWAADNGDVDTAIQIARSMVEENPDSAAAHLALSEYLRRGGFEDLADTHAEIATELDPRVRRGQAPVSARAPAAEPTKAEARAAQWAEWKGLLRKDWARVREWLEARPKVATALLAGLVLVLLAVTGVTLGTVISGDRRGEAAAAPESSRAAPYLRAAERHMAQWRLEEAERQLQYAERLAPKDKAVTTLRARLEQMKAGVVEVLPGGADTGGAYGGATVGNRASGEPVFAGAPSGLSPDNRAVLDRMFAESGGASGSGSSASGAKPAAGSAAAGAARPSGVPSRLPAPLGEPRRDLLPNVGPLAPMSEPWWIAAGPSRPGTGAPSSGGPAVGAPPAVTAPAIPSLSVPLVPTWTAPGTGEPGPTPSRSVEGSVRRASPQEAASGGSGSSASGGTARSVPAEPAAGASSSGAPATATDRGTDLLETARAHQSRGLEYQRQGQWQKAREELRAAVGASEAAARAGASQAAANSVRSASEAALRNMES